jgi:hypothetical protein
MLFKFKSQAASDLIMLEEDARRLLKIMLGDDPVKGIVQTQDLDACVLALESAVLRDQQARSSRSEQTRALGHQASDDPAGLPVVSLSQRAAPMLKMLKRCKAEDSDLVWGV